MKCPYNPKVICAYLEQSQNQIVYECDDCTHYHNRPPEAPKTREGAGFLFLVIAGIAIAILGIGFIVVQIFKKF